MTTDPFASIREGLEAFAEFQIRFRRWVDEHSIDIARFYAALAEYERYHNEEEPKDFATLAKGGWIGLERNFTSLQIRTAANIYRASGEGAMNNAVLQFFSKDECAVLANMVDEWVRVPYLKERETIVRDAFSAHKAGQFTLSIPTLLPLAEGLAADSFGLTSTKAVQIAAKNWKDTEAEAWAAEFFNVVDQVIYKSYTFGRDAATFLNRHGILHGRVLDYASALNSTRVFLLIDAIVSIREPKQQSLASTGSGP
jgi:hypothetical protein